MYYKCILLTCQIFLRVFPCTIIFLKANIFLFSASQNSCSFWTAILFFATRRIWADIRRVIQPIRLQNSSYTVNDYIIYIHLHLSPHTFHFDSIRAWSTYLPICVLWCFYTLSQSSKMLWVQFHEGIW
jgi:hypothetical protein